MNKNKFLHFYNAACRNGTISKKDAVIVVKETFKNDGISLIHARRESKINELGERFGDGRPKNKFYKSYHGKFGRKLTRSATMKLSTVVGKE